jgi:hypothetical protein
MGEPRSLYTSVCTESVCVCVICIICIGVVSVVSQYNCDY